MTVKLSILFGNVIHRYISTSLKRKLGNNIDVIDYLLAIMIMSSPKRAVIKDIDIDIDIADILGQKYRYRIDIAHSDIDPPLL